MNAYNRRAKMREARKAAMDTMSVCAEHFDLVLLLTLHEEEPHYGAKRLKRFFKRFVRKYEYYKHRYLTADDSTICGDRTDTYAMKKKLKEIGFDYDAVCDEVRNEME